MRIAVLMKDVPDLVEDLELDGDELAVDDLSFVPSEWDEQALEEALLYKEEFGGEVTVVAVDTGDVDNMLYTALAKGADHGVKLTGSFDRRLTNGARAEAFALYLRQNPHDLVLTGVQAVDDIDGQIAGRVGALLGWPHAAVVRDVRWDEAHGQIRFIQEYAGGRMAAMAARTPVVLGIQAARQSPRYVTIARTRQIMKTAQLASVPVAVDPAATLSLPMRLYRPQAAGHAEMWEGSPEDVAEKVAALLWERKLVGG